MDELKPCPFCGNKAEIHYTSSQSFATTKFFVGCNVCGVETPRIARTRKEAIITWNRRPTPENKPLTCEGCVNNGCWENEVEYGYPSPCTDCKRRASDNYARKPEVG